MIRKVSVAFLLLLFGSTLYGQSLRDPRFMARAEEGFEHIFNMDYDRAEMVFSALQKDYPLHPAPPLYIASIQWLEEMLRRQDLDLNRFLAPTYFYEKTNQVMPAAKKRIFLESLSKSESLSNAILQKNRKDKDARYFLSTAQGLRASFAITVDHRLREAFGYGNKAYSASRQLIDEDPGYYDAYLTVGIYEYVVGSLPWYMRWMVYIIAGHGSKQGGLSHLRLAAQKGQYVRDQAKLVLMVLDVRERQYPEALQFARALKSRFPRSFLFPINLAQILRLAGQREESVQLFLEVEKHVEKGEPNFNKIPARDFRFNVATQFLYMEDLDLAQERFQLVAQDPLSSPVEKALSHLRLCKILNWKKQPAAAAKACRAVLSFDDVDNSHKQANDLLRRISVNKP